MKNRHKSIAGKAHEASMMHPGSSLDERRNLIHKGSHPFVGQTVGYRLEAGKFG
jgi:hypothetical protein